ncbi:type VII secretion protein EssA [Streptococcus pluranimalium]|uniref:Type VII secretion protein EssA n=1 Tax=Streptococcus pluranimalium TaxID=82348 RepID=A0A2L0D444_9STRE|nr:type VII secretion protein EssA [Streptococcus pluranimalium]AUW96341.1 type VII secretion protein EssA [Streptococcus pluranimalium]
MKKSFLIVAVICFLLKAPLVYSDGLKDNSLQFDSERISQKEVLDTGFQPGYVSQLFKEDAHNQLQKIDQDRQKMRQKRDRDLFTTKKMMANQGEVTKLFTEQDDRQYTMTSEPVEDVGVSASQVAYIILISIVIIVSSIVTYLFYQKSNESLLEE